MAPTVAPAVLARLRTTCLGLPETVEEEAWVGTRWRVRKRTFAHVVRIDHGEPGAFARAAGTDGPATVVIFRLAGPELVAIANAGPPFFLGGWGRDAVGMVLDEGTDWTEVAELLTESYCTMAPARLRALVERPPEP